MADPTMRQSAEPENGHVSAAPADPLTTDTQMAAPPTTDSPGTDLQMAGPLAHDPTTTAPRSTDPPGGRTAQGRLPRGRTAHD